METPIAGRSVRQPGPAVRGARIPHMSGITLVDYDPAWPLEFQRESDRIQRAMGTSALRIEHVGSTAVPGLRAKPVIDIQVSVASLKPLNAHTRRLGTIGYTFIPLPVPDDPAIEHADDVYPFYQKPSTWPATHHVHLCAEGSVQEKNHIVFRDFLKDHPDQLAVYQSLKAQLAAEHDGRTLASRERYSLGKTDFVTATISRALAAGYDI